MFWLKTCFTGLKLGVKPKANVLSQDLKNISLIFGIIKFFLHYKQILIKSWIQKLKIYMFLLISIQLLKDKLFLFLKYLLGSLLFLR
jgi:hypothetical protein